MTSKEVTNSTPLGKKSSGLRSVFRAARHRVWLTPSQALLCQGTQDKKTSVMWHPQERAPLSEHLQTTNNAKLPDKHLLGVHLLLSFRQLPIQLYSNSPKETSRIVHSFLRVFLAPVGCWHPLSALNHS